MFCLLLKTIVMDHQAVSDNCVLEQPGSLQCARIASPAPNAGRASARRWSGAERRAAGLVPLLQLPDRA